MANTTDSKQIDQLQQIARTLWELRRQVLIFQHQVLQFEGTQTEDLDQVRSYLSRATGRLEGITGQSVNTYYGIKD